MRRLLIGILVAISLIVLTITPVFAISDPDSMAINGVWVYRHCIETDDQLYIIDYSIDYVSNPNENVNEAFMVRLMNGATNLGTVSPYVYQNDGYGRGIAAIYFSATDAPAWAGAYSMQIIGNPTLSWAGAPPQVTTAGFDLWSSSGGISVTQVEVANKILELAATLEIEWATDMVESTPLGNKLTTDGEAYFVNAIPSAKTIAPSAFLVQFYPPDFSKDTYTPTYATDLADNATGTPLDLSNIATTFGVSTMMMSGILYLAVVVGFLGFVIFYLRSMKGAMILTLPLIVLGALLGMIPLSVAIIIGFGAFFLTGYVLFFAKSSA